MRHIGIVQPPGDGLARVGPIVQVALRPSLLVPGKPAAIITTMMIDTGADRTVVDVRVAEELGVAPHRFVSMVGVSQKPELCPEYRLTVVLAMSDDVTGVGIDVNFSANVIGMPAPNHESAHYGLIGRDFLRHFRFTYDGPKGTFEIFYPLSVQVPDRQLPAPQTAKPPHRPEPTPGMKDESRNKRRHQKLSRKNNRPKK